MKNQYISQQENKIRLEKVLIRCYNMSLVSIFKERSQYLMSEIKVISYNVHSTIGMDQKSDCGRLAAVINQSNPHVAGLQELGVYTRRVPDVNAPLEIARHTRMNYLFSRSLVTTEAGGEYGVGAFSVYTMELKARLLLPTPEGAEPRSVLIAKVNAPTPFHFRVSLRKANFTAPSVQNSLPTPSSTTSTTPASGRGISTPSEAPTRWSISANTG